MAAPRFKGAFPYQQDVLALPVADIEVASAWYCRHFGMTEVARHLEPVPTVVLERDGIRLGFAVNGGDPAEDGAAILVSDIAAIRADLESRGLTAENWRVDSHQGQRMQVFFIVAPDGLCYYFHEPLDATP